MARPGAETPWRTVAIGSILLNLGTIGLVAIRATAHMLRIADSERNQLSKHSVRHSGSQTQDTEHAISPAPIITVRGRRIADSWFAWGLAVGGIILPILLLLPDFIETATIWAPFYSTLRQGTFLLPIFILDADALWRWVHLRGHGMANALVRLSVLVICMFTSVLSYSAAVIAASLAHTPRVEAAAGPVISIITVSCLTVLLPISAIGVSRDVRDAESNEG
jgi:hypothetical protein